MLRCLLVLFALAIVAPASAQVPVPTAGTHFTFGIVEGPDAAVTSGELQSELFLTVLSRFSGCGLIVSPSGYSQQFSFEANKPQQVGLDYSLMQTNDLGKSLKGLILQTSQPVNAYFHDWTQSGGDATQLFPDEALDTTYVVGGWGLWNDPGEQNHACVLVAANTDSTDVVIVPAVNALGGIPAKIPFTVRLNRGETYILKADITSQPSSTSLSGTVVTASKPVSVFSGVTCAYVPIGRESCNELLDQILGKKWWTKHYFAQPLGNGDSTVRLILTSDRDFFASMNGAPAFSSNGRIETSFDRPVEITSNEPIQVQQIVGGSEISGAGVGDPSLVTLFGAEHYDDTLFWSIPNLGMANFAPIVVPTANIPQTFLDGQPLTSYGTPTTINGSAYSALRVSVYPGAHTLQSPAGVFTLGVGFDIYDAFTFIAGSVGQELPRDTITRTILLTLDSAATCDTFSAVFSLDSALTTASGVTDLSPTLRYDPSLMTLVSFTPGDALRGSAYSVDTSLPGIIRIHILGKPLVEGKGLFTVVFFGKASGDATFSTVLAAGACGEQHQIFVGANTSFTIQPSDLTMPRVFHVADTNSSNHVTCENYVLILLADTTITQRDRFVPLSIQYVYSAADDELVSGSLSSALTPYYRGTRNTTGSYAIDLTAGGPVLGTDTLASFSIIPIAAGTHHAKFIVRYLLCADTITKEIPFDYPVAINIDSLHARLSLTTSPVTWGNESSADITLSGLPIDAHVKTFTLDVQYDHDVISLFRAQNVGTLTNGWQISGPITPTPQTDRFTFTSNGSELGTSGPLVHLLFRTFVSDSTSTPIQISSSLANASLCPIVFQTPVVSQTYAGRDLCGDSITRRFLLQNPITLDAIHVNAQTVSLRARSSLDGEADVAILDVLGHSLIERRIAVTRGHFLLDLPAPASSGTYVMRVSLGGSLESRRFAIVR